MNLEKAYYALVEDARIAERNYDDAYRRMKDDAERRIRLFLGCTETGVVMKDLFKARDEAYRLMIEEKERQAKAGNDAPYPVGTRMKRTKSVRRSGRYRGDETTIYGVIEGVTRETVYPDTMSHRSWRKPSIGSYIVRILKNDGTPSKNFENVYSEWSPVDENIERATPAHIEL